MSCKLGLEATVTEREREIQKRKNSRDYLFTQNSKCKTKK